MASYIPDSMCSFALSETRLFAQDRFAPPVVDFWEGLAEDKEGFDHMMQQHKQMK